MKNVFRADLGNGHTMTIQADPNGKFKNVEPHRLLDAAGLIPNFVAEYDGEKSLKTTIEDAYGFGSLHPMGGEITKDWIYTYPEDPILYPLVSIYTNHMETGEFVLVYQSGITAIPTKDGWFVTRLD